MTEAMCCRIAVRAAAESRVRNASSTARCSSTTGCTLAVRAFYSSSAQLGEVDRRRHISSTWLRMTALRVAVAITMWKA